jgi:hypothetical protein
MIRQIDDAKDFLQKKFIDLTKVPAGTYAVPTHTSKGKAFMKVIISDKGGMSGFDLWWDEEMTLSWYTEPKPIKKPTTI